MPSDNNFRAIFQDVANSIRAKTGSDEKMQPNTFADNIDKIGVKIPEVTEIAGIEVDENSGISNKTILHPFDSEGKLIKSKELFPVTKASLLVEDDGKTPVKLNQQATEETLGGIKAAIKTDKDTQEVKIEPALGKLYTSIPEDIPTYQKIHNSATTKLYEAKKAGEAEAVIHPETTVESIITADGEVAQLVTYQKETFKPTWFGTAVPKEGYVDTVYFNTDLSIEDTSTLIENNIKTNSLNYYNCLIWQSSSGYKLQIRRLNNSKTDFFNSISVFKENKETFIFANGSENTLNYFNITKKGWQEIANSPLVVKLNTDLLSESGNPRGLSEETREQLSSLISIKPFTYKEPDPDKYTLEEASTKTKIYPTTLLSNIEVEQGQKLSLKTVNGKSIIGTGDIHTPQATEDAIGGITAANKTEADSQEVKIDPETGKLFTLPGGGAMVPFVEEPPLTKEEFDKHSIYLNLSKQEISYLKSFINFNSPTEELLQNQIPGGVSHNPAIAAVGHNIYIFGGYLQNVSNWKGNKIQKYNIDTHEYSYIGEIPDFSSGSIFNGARARTVNNIIYVIGGGNRIYKFDTTTESIEIFVKLPKSTYCCGAEIINNYIYILSGYGEDNYYNNRSSYKVNLDTKEITKIKNIPFSDGLDSFGTYAVGEDIYCFGGHCIDWYNAYEKPLNLIFVYNTCTNSYKKIGTIPLASYDINVGRIGNYLIFNEGQTYTNDRDGNVVIAKNYPKKLYRFNLLDESLAVEQWMDLQAILGDGYLDDSNLITIDNNIYILGLKKESTSFFSNNILKISTRTGYKLQNISSGPSWQYVEVK